MIEDGYVFAKGKSRGISHMESTPPKKRAKLSSEERNREIESLQENLKVLKNRLTFKNQQLQKEKSMSNYKQCDTISAEILEVQKEKRSVDRQLTALMKKDAKARWYQNSDKSKKDSKKNKEVRDNQSKLPSLFKEISTSTTSSASGSDDTIILSDNEEATKKSSNDLPILVNNNWEIEKNNDAELCPSLAPHSSNSRDGTDAIVEDNQAFVSNPLHTVVTPVERAQSSM